MDRRRRRRRLGQNDQVGRVLEPAGEILVGQLLLLHGQPGDDRRPQGQRQLRQGFLDGGQIRPSVADVGVVSENGK